MSGEPDPGHQEPGHHHHPIDPSEIAEVISDDRDDIDLEEEVEKLVTADLRDRTSVLNSAERPALIDAMGGPLGMAESSIPSIAFVVAVTFGSDIETAAIVAVGFALATGIARAVRKQTIQFAVTGVIGVAFSAWVASKTGEARDFFLPGFFFNAGYAAIAFISVAIRRPFIGYIVVGFAGGQGNWREDPEKMRRFRLASLLWGGLFVARLVVQLPLYFADMLVALGTAKLAMSYPLFGIGIWLTWLLVKAPVKEAKETEPTPSTPA